MRTQTRRRRAPTLILVALLACGGRASAPKPPPPLDAKQLAQLIYADLIGLGEIARRLRGKCAEVTAELRPHVARMKIRKTDVEHMLRDPKQAKDLEVALATYAERIKGLTDTTATDLAETYRSCCPRDGKANAMLAPKGDAAPKPAPSDSDPIPAPKGEVDQKPVPKRAPAPKVEVCQAAYQLERVIADMPTY